MSYYDPNSWTPEIRARIETDIATTRGVPPHAVYEYVLVRYEDITSALAHMDYLQEMLDIAI